MSSAPSSLSTSSARRVVRPEPRVGAFFDMDKTLIAENSGSLYMKYRYERGEVTGWDLAKGLGAYMQYKVGLLDIRAWTLGMLVQFKGQDEKELTEEARAWFERRGVAVIWSKPRLDGRTAASHRVAGRIRWR